MLSSETSGDLVQDIGQNSPAFTSKFCPLYNIIAEHFILSYWQFIMQNWYIFIVSILFIIKWIPQKLVAYNYRVSV